MSLITSKKPIRGCKKVNSVLCSLMIYNDILKTFKRTQHFENDYNVHKCLVMQACKIEFQVFIKS